MTLGEFNRRFRIVPTSLLGRPRDLRNAPKPQGDCQDYAKTVKAIEGASFPRAIVWRCWSPINGKIPRHAVLWVKGKGWIDSTERKWRKTPAPHKKAWPVGAPIVIGLAAAARFWGWW
jgi:hypothetical protein